MPRSAATNEALRAATRERLLLAALAVFAERGYEGATVREIAQRADVATGLLYRHFDGKDALLHATFGRSMDDVRATFAAALAASPADAIGTLVRAAVATVRTHLDFWRLGYAARHQPSVVAALGPALGAWTDEIVGVLTNLLRHQGSPDPAHDARALFAQVDGACEHFALDPAHYPIDAVADRIITRWSLPAGTPHAAAAPPPPSAPRPPHRRHSRRRDR